MKKIVSVGESKVRFRKRRRTPNTRGQNFRKVMGDQSSDEEIVEKNGQVFRTSKKYPKTERPGLSKFETEQGMLKNAPKRTSAVEPIGASSPSPSSSLSNIFEGDCRKILEAGSNEPVDPPSSGSKSNNPKSKTRRDMLEEACKRTLAAGYSKPFGGPPSSSKANSNYDTGMGSAIKPLPENQWLKGLSLPEIRRLSNEGQRANTFSPKKSDSCSTPTMQSPSEPFNTAAQRRAHQRLDTETQLAYNPNTDTFKLKHQVVKWVKLGDINKDVSWGYFRKVNDNEMVGGYLIKKIINKHEQDMAIALDSLLVEHNIYRGGIHVPWQSCQVGTQEWSFQRKGYPVKDFLNDHEVCDDELCLAAKKYVLKRIAEIILSIHEKGYAHCDIKPDNVILIEGSDGEFEVRLIDFEHAQRKIEGNIAVDRYTLHYAPQGNQRVWDGLYYDGFCFMNLVNDFSHISGLNKNVFTKDTVTKDTVTKDNVETLLKSFIIDMEGGERRLISSRFQEYARKRFGSNQGSVSSSSSSSSSASSSYSSSSSFVKYLDKESSQNA